MGLLETEILTIAKGNCSLPKGSGFQEFLYNKFNIKKMIIWLEKRRIVSLIFTLLMAVEIFFFSTISFALEKKGIISFSIVYHFIVFFLFSFFLFITIKGKRKIKIKYILIVLFISIIYAILDEFHQAFIPYRDASIKDILINSLGIFSSMLIYLYINKKQNKKESL